MAGKQSPTLPKRQNSITVFFPAYNDEGSIGEMVRTAVGVVSQLTSDFELIVVDDGSEDGTRDVLRRMAAVTPQLRVIHHPRNLGYGGALRTGFSQATRDLIFYTDGDGQYDVGELLTLAPLMTSEVDVVNGYKRKRADNLRRRVLGGVYRLVARTMFGLPIRDVDCDFRLMRRAAIQAVDLSANSGVVCAEMVYKLHRAGCRFTETPVHHYPRLHGQSQFFTLRRISRTGLDFMILWFRLVIWGRMTGWIRKTATLASGETS
ncbi:MAG: glycosyltransferase family 2 protein [Blastocatellia bacterium]